MKQISSTPIRTGTRDRKGAALISLIAVMLIVGVLGVSVITLTHTTEHSHLSANAGTRAYYLAESGLRYAQQIYCSEDWLHGRQRTLTLQGGEQVDIIRISNNFWSTAFVDVGTAQEARARVPMPLSLCGVDPDAGPVDEFAVFGDTAIFLGNNTVIQGDVAIADEDVEIKGDVEGSVLAKDVVMSSSDASVSGDIYSSGLVDISTGIVTGDIHSATGIILRSAQVTIFEGWLFSNGSIEAGGKAHVLGHVHSCGGDVTVNGSAIIGTAEEPIEIRASGNVYLSGSAMVYGNVYAGGNIELSNNATIDGNAYAGGTVSNSDSITGDSFQGAYTYLLEPICPDLDLLEDLNLPDVTEFTAGGSDVTVPAGSKASPSEYFLAPGSYGVLSSPDNSKNTLLYLNAGEDDHGNYYFNSVTFGNFMTLCLDLSGAYDLRVFITGTILVGRELNVLVSTDGTTYSELSSLSDEMKLDLGARVYWESHLDYSLEQASNWLGTVYTPYGNLSTNGSYLIGSFFSGGGHTLENSTVFHVAPNYFTEE